MILKKIPEDVDFFNAVVIYCTTKDGRAPLLKKRSDHPVYPDLWGFPAGKVKETDNCLTAAAVREVEEETGTVVNMWDMLHSGMSSSIVHRKLSGEKFHFVAHLFFLKNGIYINDEVIIDDEEHDTCLLLRPRFISNFEKIMIPDAHETFIKFCNSNGDSRG